MIEIKTERLIITPITEEELLNLITRYKNIFPELSIAYQEMLDNCRQHKDEFIWFIPWKISLIENKKEVGYASFKGFNKGYPEIGYGVNDEYQGNGYATEAIKALCEWIMKMPEVIAIEAEVEPNNDKSNKVLIKNGFIKNGIMGLEGPRYILKK